MQKNQQIWEHLNKNIIEYSRMKTEAEIIKSRQDELKKEIVTDMDFLEIRKQSLKDITDEGEKNVDCTLISPTEIIYNLLTIKADFPNMVEYTTRLSLDDAEHISAFKLRLKEYGLSDVKIRKLINETMTVQNIETVNENKMQKKIDKGEIDNISKYANIIEKPKYIKVVIKDANV